MKKIGDRILQYLSACFWAFQLSCGVNLQQNGFLESRKRIGKEDAEDFMGFDDIPEHP